TSPALPGVAHPAPKARSSTTANTTLSSRDTLTWDDRPCDSGRDTGSPRRGSALIECIDLGVHHLDCRVHLVHQGVDLIDERAGAVSRRVESRRVGVGKAVDSLLVRADDLVVELSDLHGEVQHTVRRISNLSRLGPPLLCLLFGFAGSTALRCQLFVLVVSVALGVRARAHSDGHLAASNPKQHTGRDRQAKPAALETRPIRPRYGRPRRGLRGRRFDIAHPASASLSLFWASRASITA